MAEEQGTIETNEHVEENPDGSPKTLETGTAQEIKEFSKEGNKTISSNTKIKKKKKISKLNLESRNSSNGFYKQYRSTSRTEAYK